MKILNNGTFSLSHVSRLNFICILYEGFSCTCTRIDLCVRIFTSWHILYVLKIRNFFRTFNTNKISYQKFGIFFDFDIHSPIFTKKQILTSIKENLKR